VLLIDADFSSPSVFPEYESGGPTLAEMLTVPGDEAVFRVAVKEALEGLQAVVPELWGLSAGDLDRRPADVVGSRRFDVLIRESKEIADIVLVVTPEAAEPATLTIVQRVEELFLVAKARSTTIPHLETVVDALDSRRARFLGVVLLDRRREGVAKLRSRGAHVRKS
jgi:Mrp family chromosome partitioning ATPase